MDIISILRILFINIRRLMVRRCFFLVLQFFVHDGWFDGEITAYDKVHSWYQVGYSDGDIEDYSEEEVSPLVLNAEERSPERPTKKLKLQLRSVESPSKMVESVCLWTNYGIDPKTIQVPHEFPESLAKHKPNIAEFFLFVFERQSMWERRDRDLFDEEVGLSRNPLFREFSWCNVYRELDRGTAYFHSHVLDLKDQNPNASRGDWLTLILWASYVYRKVNRIETFMALGFPTIQSQSWLKFIEDGKKVRDSGKQFFTDAHTASFSIETLSDYLSLIAGKEAMLLRSVVEDLLKAHDDMEMCLNVLKRLPGVGTFLAWQVLCDLVESHCFKFEKDNYCELGPGARGKCLCLCVSVLSFWG